MTTSTERETLKLQPDWRFVLSHPAHFLAFGFGSGLARKAPGTGARWPLIPCSLC